MQVEKNVKEVDRQEEKIADNCLVSTIEGVRYEAQETDKSHIIEVPEGLSYLGEQNFMTELPVNCLFHKGKTGCGGTELALTNDKHTIIAMPFIPLVRNKAEKEDHASLVLGVDGDTSIEDIKTYVKDRKVWKIVVVYDSLPKVIKAFQEIDINPYEKCFLLVDEYHVLFTHYNFRSGAIRNLLHESSKFHERTFMSATPLHDEFMLKELKELPVYKVVWPNKSKCTVVLQPTTSPQRCTIELIKHKINNEEFGNLHFFINSVEFILNILKETDILPDKVRIVCANNKENKKRLGKYVIGRPSDSPSKLNFYTSTCFEGIDIFDDKGRIYIISNNWDSNTLYDISTVFTQIIGRLRDSEYKNEVVHIVSFPKEKGKYNYEKYKESQDNIYRISQGAIESINLEDINKRKEYFDKGESNQFLGDRYIYVDEEFNYSMDENLLKKDLFDYKIRETYNDSILLAKTYKKNGFDLKVKGSKYYPDASKNNPKGQSSFKKAIEYLHQLVTTSNMEDHHIEELTQLKIQFNYIEDAYYKLGIKQIREWKYNTGLIKRKLREMSDASHENEIIEGIKKNIGFGKPIDQSMAKVKFQEVYESLGINKKATASKLEKYVDVKNSTIKRGGKSVRQMILSKKEPSLLEKVDFED